jgi:hypothetical protein
MLSDPQSLTINGVGTNFYKTQVGPNGCTYTSGDGLKILTVKQNVTASRFRREVRISQNKVAADPVSAVNSLAGTSVYLVIDEPKSGVFTDSELNYLASALSVWQGTGNFTQILRGES